VRRERRSLGGANSGYSLQRPALSISRKIGLLTLRGYIVFAIVIMVTKLVQFTTAHQRRALQQV
jgi:hypothetical protein